MPLSQKYRRQRTSLHKLPTAKIIERKEGAYILEAEVYGDGVRMWLLSQGSWVRALSPPEFVRQMREEVQKLSDLYAEPGVGLYTSNV